MAKITREEEARRSGVGYAYNIIAKSIADGKTADEAIKVLEEEIKFRNITKVPLPIPRSEVERFNQELKHNCVITFKLLTMVTLHDEFGFGNLRLGRFDDRFDIKADCIAGGYATWEDNADILLDECRRKIKGFDEFWLKVQEINKEAKDV